MEALAVNGNGKSKVSGNPRVAGLLDIEVTVEGITPLLLNRMSEEQLLALVSKIKAPKAANVGQMIIPRDVAEPKVYVDEKGNPIIPARMIYASLVAAGQSVRLDGKKQVSTAKSTVLPSFLSLPGISYPLVVPGTTKPASWEPDITKGTNPNGGEAVCIIRPRFDAWALKVTCQVDLAQIGEGTVRTLFDIAGRRCGLGDFRPARKGIFGQFQVVHWDRI